MEGAAVVGLLSLRSAPSFFVAILVLMVFSYQLGWFPPGGMISIGGYQESFWATIFTWDFLHHPILPTLVLMSREITSPALLLRSTMLDVKGSAFLELLRSKGTPARPIIFYATPHALLP